MASPGQPPRARWTGLRVRMYAPSDLVSGNFVHSAEYMRLALNPGGGSGGTCFGDSGGPDLLGGTSTVRSFLKVLPGDISVNRENVRDTDVTDEHG